MKLLTPACTRYAISKTSPDILLNCLAPSLIYTNSCLFISSQGSRDNMSVVLVCFPGAPKVSSEAVKREAELDKYLEARVEGREGEKKCFCSCCLVDINIEENS